MESYISYYKIVLANGAELELGLTMGMSKLQGILTGGDFIADKLTVIRVPAIAAVERITKEQYIKDHDGKTYEEIISELKQSIDAAKENENV